MLLLLLGSLPGCGLVFDAVELMYPLTRDEISTICARGQVRIGISVEPFRPFVFPAVYTDEGVRVTGFDVELIQEVAGALTAHCGGQQPVVPTLHLTRFRDLFIELNEGHLDLFVSSFSGNVPGASPLGLWSSIPYFHGGGVGIIARNQDVIDRIHTQFRKQDGHGGTLTAIRQGLSGMTIAVQEGRSAQLYAQANLTQTRLLLCDSLPAAIETKGPPIDVILANHAILQYVTARVWPDWHLLDRPDGSPLLLTQEHFSIVTGEEKRGLQWFLNNLLFRLEESGQLIRMQKRWLEEDYAPTRRATDEGLPLEVSKVPDHYDQGQCRMQGRR
jgi:ABC-type amino acid transport substrate-binding protein